MSIDPAGRAVHWPKVGILSRRSVTMACRLCRTTRRLKQLRETSGSNRHCVQSEIRPGWAADVSKRLRLAFRHAGHLTGQNRAKEFPPDGRRSRILRNGTRVPVARGVRAFAPAGGASPIAHARRVLGELAGAFSSDSSQPLPLGLFQLFRSRSRLSRLPFPTCPGQSSAVA